MLDPYSYEDRNIAHFLVSGQELQRINGVLGAEHEQSRTMTFRLVPDAAPARNSIDSYLVDIETGDRVSSTVSVAWDDRHGAGDEIPFEIAFFDEGRGLLRDVKYAYFLIGPGGEKLLEEGTASDDPTDIGISALEGIDYQTLTLPEPGLYRLDVAILGTGTGYDSRYAGIASVLIEIGPPGGGGAPADGGGAPAADDGAPAADDGAPAAVPGWIRASTGFWVDGHTTDAEFVSAIEFLIREGVMEISPAERAAPGGGGGGEEGAPAVPGWVKSTAGFWVDGAHIRRRVRRRTAVPDRAGRYQRRPPFLRRRRRVTR